VNTLPEFIGGEPTPWIGDLVRDQVQDVVSFEGFGYPIRMDAVGDNLVWSVPEATARALGRRSSFESRVERFAVSPSVEVWRFPKLEREPVHEVILLLDRKQGTAASLELVLRSTKQGSHPDLRILRGTLAGYPQAYSGFAFPRYKPGERRVSIGSSDATWFLEFDRTGQPSAVGRTRTRWRASGHVLVVAPGVWAVVWRTAGTVAFALLDEIAGVVNGEAVSVGQDGASTFGIRTEFVRSF